ncbi:DNA primase, partial [Acinetobacter baumannii]|nr:DNA primase [Acinetobacter baumannii]
VIAAFDKEALMSVSISIRENNPSASIYIGADNDLNEQLNGTTKQNGGVLKAIEAAQAVGGNVLIPPVKKDELELSDWNDLELKYGTKYCHEVLKRQLQDIAQYNQNKQPNIQPVNSNLPPMASSFRPQINIQKTTATLDPAIFTAWLIQSLDQKGEELTKSGQSIKDLRQATDIVKAIGSDDKKQIVPMLKYICHKNGWHDLDQAIQLISDKLDNKINNERETLNRVNLTLQTLLYTSLT